MLLKERKQSELKKKIKAVQKPGGLQHSKINVDPDQNHKHNLNCFMRG